MSGVRWTRTTRTCTSVGDEALHFSYKEGSSFLGDTEIPRIFHGHFSVAGKRWEREGRTVKLITGYGGPGTTEAIYHEKTGLLVEPNQPKQLAEAIERLFNNPDLGKKLAQNGIELLTKKFSWEAHLQKLNAKRKMRRPL